MLLNIPEYLRFKTVSIFFQGFNTNILVQEKCNSVHSFLSRFKDPMLGSELSTYAVINDQNLSDFESCDSLLHYLNKDLLMNFSKWTGVNLIVWFESDKPSASKFISSALNELKIDSYSLNIYINLVWNEILLPTDIVINWLLKPADSGRRLHLHAFKLGSIFEIVETLRWVKIFLFINANIRY